MSDALPITPKALMDATGVSSGFASLVVRRKKRLPKRIAIRLYNKTGQKLGPIENLSRAEIAALEKALAAEANAE